MVIPRREVQLATWADFARSAPRLAELAQQQLIEPGVVLLGTVRRDGTPRISPVEPLLWDGQLWLSMLFGSQKAADLQRDPRLLVHNIVTGADGEAGEIKVRGVAVRIPPGPLLDGYAKEVRRTLDWEPTPGRVHLFQVDVRDVTYIRYDGTTGDQFVARWPNEVEFVRRGDGGSLTPTSWRQVTEIHHWARRPLAATLHPLPLIASARVGTSSEIRPPASALSQPLTAVPPR